MVLFLVDSVVLTSIYTMNAIPHVDIPSITERDKASDAPNS